MTPPRPEEAVDRNGSGGIALTALPYGALTTSIINLPNVIGKALTEEKISSGVGVWTRLNQLDPRKQRISNTRFGHNAITSNAKQSF